MEEEKKEVTEVTEEKQEQTNRNDDAWDGINGRRPNDPNDSLEFPLKERIKKFLDEYTSAKTEEEKIAKKEQFKKDIRQCKSKTSVLAALEHVFRARIEGYQFICEELEKLLFENPKLPSEDFGENYKVDDNDDMVERMRSIAEAEMKEGSTVDHIDSDGRIRRSGL